MSRFLPKSLLGQTLLAVAAALLVAQLISAAMLYNAAEIRREERLIFPATIGLLGDNGSEQAMGRFRERFLHDSPRKRGRRPLRGEITQSFPLLPGETNNPRWAKALEDNLRAPHGVTPYRILAIQRSPRSDPTVLRRINHWDPKRKEMFFWRGEIFVAAMQLEEGGPWRVARVWNPPTDKRGIVLIAAYTAGLFVILMGVLYLLLRRITRPLATLTNRVDAFSRTPDQAVRLEESGPQDMRRLIAAHNAMEARVAALIDEKDVMLGAIGHDLKTPLAALRVRIESVPDDTQRARMADSIEDITHTLDDILSLARIGRSGVEAELTDLAALTASVAEEFEDLGDPVTLEALERVTLPVHVTWLKRALRNLVSNAVRYGQTARVSLLSDGNDIVLRVDDDGPGIPEDAIADMLEPFQRGEVSRNRSTGGAGLGLTLARAIAEQHGGTLSLQNRTDGGKITGLRAEIRLR